MFDFSYSLIVGSSLLHLISLEALSQGSVAIAMCEGVKHPYVEECALPISPTEALSYYIQSCTIVSVRETVCQSLSCHRLQVGFGDYAMADLT